MTERRPPAATSRHARPREVRASVIKVRDRRFHLTLAPLTPEEEDLRPKTRADCENGPRPCPWVGCRYHLYLDVLRAGGLMLNFPDLEPDEMIETCALDVAERGGLPQEAVGVLVNLTRARVQQMEEEAFKKRGVKRTLDIFVEGEKRVRKARFYLYESDFEGVPDPDEGAEFGEDTSGEEPLG